MENKHLLLPELNNALVDYYNQDSQNRSYTFLFHPLQKANKILLENNIDIFNLKQEKNLFDANLNGLGKLLTSSVKARNIILENNLGLTKKIANKYVQKIPQSECSDLESEGVFGLLKAIEKYNPALNIPFSHFALPVMENHIKTNMNKYLRTIKLPTNFIFDYKWMIKFEDEFKQKFTRKPNDEELAEFMDKPIKYVKRLKENNNKLYDLASSDTTPMFQGSGQDDLIEDTKQYLIDYIADENSFFEDRVINKIIKQELIENYISKLPEEQEEILFQILQNKKCPEIAVCAGETDLMIRKSKRFSKRQSIHGRYVKGVQKIKELNALKNI